MAQDFYEVLGLDKDADPEQIRQAYRSEVKKCHPDASGTGASAARFRDVEEAYETLRDTDRRRAYDRTLGRRGSRSRGPAASATAREAPAEPIVPSGWGFEEDAYDLLFAGFGGVGRRRFAGPLLEILLSPEEARRGVSVPVEIPLCGPCPECSGAGLWARLTCFTCGGTGRVCRAGRVILEIPQGIRHGSEFECELGPSSAAPVFRVRVRVGYP